MSQTQVPTQQQTPAPWVATKGLPRRQNLPDNPAFKRTKILKVAPSINLVDRGTARHWE